MRGVAVVAILGAALLLPRPAAYGLVLECPSTLGPWVLESDSGKVLTDGELHGMQCDYVDTAGARMYRLDAFWEEPGDGGNGAGPVNYCTEPEAKIGDAVGSPTRSALVDYGNNDNLQIPADALHKSAQLLADVEPRAAECPNAVVAAAPDASVPSPAAESDAEVQAAPVPRAAPKSAAPDSAAPESVDDGGGINGLGIAAALLGAAGVGTPLLTRWQRSRRSRRGRDADDGPRPDLSPQRGEGYAAGRMYGEWVVRSVVPTHLPDPRAPSTGEPAPRR